MAVTGDNPLPSIVAVVPFTTESHGISDAFSRARSRGITCDAFF